MENLVNPAVWQGKSVFLTGHTGFKGGWLALWLAEMGAQVTGFSLAAPTDPSLFEAADIAGLVQHIEGDIREREALIAAMRIARPDVVFHLAAQPIVRLSYMEPVETYATNVMGTVHLLDAVRQIGGPCAVVCVTSDKCYENREWVWPYRENDPVGGHDPYSSSKGCAELVVAAYRRSYFEPARLREHGIGVASVRAGNVIGGGDWAHDRLVPDLIRSRSTGTAPEIRSPDAVRPWQHVLDALAGYLLVAERLLAGDASAADAWNFGPADEDTRPVRSIVRRLGALWGWRDNWTAPATQQPHEAKVLRLDCSKARTRLAWRPRITLEATLQSIVEWHDAYDNGCDVREVSLAQLRRYGFLPPAETNVRKASA
ncbi:CDP-glucose 4,6-dehydratase [Iodidimonas sp. SYSU 1G8]|uniref:CDP-glucose 4,6-dehydratase n=1 Tax=Iodidimonas sp. SYSU 1G8 TaxID=3133967 RepID=UPI0031FF363F